MSTKTKRTFGLSTLSVKNRTTVFVLTLIILFAGITSYNSMPKESFPELVIPQIYVGVPYPGNSPADIEETITDPLEKEINGITGVDKLTSTSIQGYATIFVEFDFSVSPEEALRKVKDAVDKARGDKAFPKDLPQEPNIFEMNFSEFPIMNVNLSVDKNSENKATRKKLKEYAEMLEDKIENLTEISKVEIRGLPEKEVKVNVRPHDMAARKVSFYDIETAITAHNLNLSLGDILAGEQRKTLRVVGKYTNIEEMNRLIIKRERLQTVFLEDVADIVFEEQEPTSFAREFGEPVVMLDVVKRSGENLLAASDTIMALLADAQATNLLDGAIYSITNDQSDKTRSSVDNLENSIISGVILVVLVLLFFLGLRNALFVGIAIPLSMFMAFMILGALGVSLNMIVLFGLILALGMLVDNGIVVVENIYRFMDEGEKPIQAAIHGVGEVAVPIIASTATTLAAFLPLAFWPGMMGEFMKYLPLTLIIVLGSSLFVALVINPVLAATFMYVDEKKVNKKKKLVLAFSTVALGLVLLLVQKFTLGNLLVIFGLMTAVNLYILSPATKVFQEKLLPWMENGYKGFLTNALSKPKTYLGGTFALLLVSFVLIGAFTPKVEFFPVNMPNYVNIFIEKPIGTDITATNKVALLVEKKVSKVLEKYEIVEEGTGENYNFLVASFIAQVGEGTSDPNQGPALGSTPHKARVTVSFEKFSERRDPRTGDFVSTLDVMEDIRDAVEDVPGARITVDKDNAGPPRAKPINIELKGEDYEILFATAEKVKHFLDSKNVRGVESLVLDIENTKPEIIIEIDKEAAERYDIKLNMIAGTIRTALFGKDVSKYKYDNEDYDIVVRMGDSYRYDIDALLDQVITFRDPSNGKVSQVPISSVASIKEQNSFSAVKRKDLDRIITISSNINKGGNAQEVVVKLKKVMEGFDYPKDKMEISFTGEMEDQQKEMAFLSKALLMALALIIFIIVMQFNSVSTPAIVGTAVLLSLIGVLLGLVIFQMDFIIIMTMIGIISLAGIVVNNAIVLIDYTNLLIIARKEELNIEEEKYLPINEIIKCTIEGGKTRLRPVLLTAITTILGLLPLATGLNINFFTMLSEFNPQIYFGGDNSVFWGPMSWTIIFGLTFATFLTLIIVPVMYLLAAKLKQKIVKR